MVLGGNNQNQIMSGIGILICDLSWRDRCLLYLTNAVYCWVISLITAFNLLDHPTEIQIIRIGCRDWDVLLFNQVILRMVSMKIWCFFVACIIIYGSVNIVLLEAPHRFRIIAVHLVCILFCSVKPTLAYFDSGFYNNPFGLTRSVNGWWAYLWTASGILNNAVIKLYILSKHFQVLHLGILHWCAMVLFTVNQVNERILSKLVKFWARHYVKEEIIWISVLYRSEA